MPPDKDHARNQLRHAVKAVRAILESESEQECGSSESEGEGDQRKICTASASSDSNKHRSTEEPKGRPGPDTDRGPQASGGPGLSIVEGYPLWVEKTWRFGLLETTSLWKEGNLTERFLFICRGCGEVHDVGKCQMEESFNLIHQWYNPTKHAGQLPEAAEKMLNQNARQV